MQCDPKIQRVFHEVIKIIDCTIIEAHRPLERQNELVRTGFSKTPWPLSKHNTMPSQAVDAVPCPTMWDDTDIMYYFAGVVMSVSSILHIPLRWGGDWDSDGDFTDQSFMDLAHFELLDPSPMDTQV